MRGERKTSFSDECDVLDTSRWTWEGQRPQAIGGEFVLACPAGVQFNSRLRTIKALGYGDYSVRFRTSGPRLPNLGYDIFQFTASQGTGEPGHMETSLFEIFGNHAPPGYPSNYVDCSTYVDGVHNGYGKIPQGDHMQTNYENGAYHTWSLQYRNSLLVARIDGEEYCRVTNPAYIPQPPMYFYAGAITTSGITQPWTLYLDAITFEAVLAPSHLLRRRTRRSKPSISLIYR